MPIFPFSYSFTGLFPFSLFFFSHLLYGGGGYDNCWSVSRCDAHIFITSVIITRNQTLEYNKGALLDERAIFFQEDIVLYGQEILAILSSELLQKKSTRTFVY